MLICVTTCMIKSSKTDYELIESKLIIVQLREALSESNDLANDNHQLVQ